MVDEKTVRKIAELARLSLSEGEIKRFSKELSSILDAFKDLQSVNTDGIKPTFQPVDVKNVVRDDVVEKCLSQQKALANTKNKEKGFFKGPRVI